MEAAGITALVVMPIILMMGMRMRDDVNAKGGCPECGTEVPTFRRPASVRQALWGGWTCSECGTEMDRHGNDTRQA